MARVNDGEIQFSLDKNSSMEDLIRETFYYTLALKKDYVSAYEVDKKTNEVLVKTGRNRMQESDFVGDEGFDFNPYDDWEKQQETREDFFHVDSDARMLELMEAISYMNNDDYEKCIIIQFMKNGLHLKYRNSFKLVEKLKYNKNDDISKEDKEHYEQLNKFINEKVKQKQDEFEPKMNKYWNDFYSQIKQCTNYYSQLVDYLKSISTKLIDIESPIKDMLVSIKNAWIGQYRSTLTPEESIPNYGEYLLSKDRESIRIFTEALKDLRAKVNKLVNVNIEEGCKLLNIASSRIRGDGVYVQALHEMYSIFGIDEN